MNAATAVVPTSPAPRRRWLGRIFGFVLVSLVLLAALAPSIVSWSPALRNALIRRAVGDLNGEIVFQDFSLGWLSPLAITGLELRPLPGGSGPCTASGESLVVVERLETDRPLWKILWNPTDAGTVRVERPSVFIKLTKQDNISGSNFQEVFQPLLAGPAGPPKPPGTLRFGLKARIVDGTIRGISLQNNQPWQITGINLGVGTRPASISPSGKAELLVDRGTLIAKQEISVGLCNDVFKFVAPPIGNVAQSKGMVTLDVDDWRLPWNDFGGGELSGRLAMHSVEVGPGPITQGIIGWIDRMPLLGDLYRSLKVPTFVQIAHECIVPFRMVPGGRIYHENLRFSVAELVDVQSRGTVGFDETLDLISDLGIHPPKPEERRLALLRTLTTQAWPVKIRGTLSAPQLDLSPLNDAWKQLVFQKLPQDWQSGRSSVGADLLNTIAEKTGAPVDSGTVGAVLQLLGPMLTKAHKTAPPAGSGTMPLSAGSAVPPAPAPRDLETPAPPRPSGTLPPPSPQATGSSVAGQIADGVGIAVDVLEALRARRQAALQQQRPLVAPDGSLPPPPPPHAGRRPLLRNGLRMLLEATEKPAPPAPSATPSATGK